MDNFAPLPSSRLFLDFCESLVQTLPSTIQQVTKDEVQSIDRLTTESGSGSVLRVRLDSGKEVLCKSVVVGTSCVSPVIPHWARSKMNQYPSILAYGDVDLRTNDIFKGKTVAVIGGGMMAALLATKAADLGAEHVHMISRRPLKQRYFDCDVGWWGSKYINGYLDIEDRSIRLRRSREARGQGTISPLLWSRLLRSACTNNINVLEAVNILSAEFTEDCRWKIDLEETNDLGKKISASGRSAKTEFSIQKREMESKDQVQNENDCMPSFLTNISCDLIWIACGNAFDVEEHPLLHEMYRKVPLETVGGYPCLQDGSFSWGNTPVFLVGRSAMLSAGPACYTMAGMKVSSDKIAQVLSKYLEGNLTEYTLDEQESSNGQMFDPVIRQKEWTSYEKDSEDKIGDRQLVLSKESEDIMFVSKPIRKKASKSHDSIDTSDFSPSLARKQVESFSFGDDEFEISIFINLPEPISKDDIRFRATETSLEAWAVGKEAAYHLHIPKLYGKILPERSKVVAKEGRNRIILILHKEKNSEWCFLKG